MLTTDMQEHASLGACTEHEFVIVYCRCDIIHHDMVVAAHTTPLRYSPAKPGRLTLPVVWTTFPSSGPSFRLPLLKTADVLVLIELKETDSQEVAPFYVPFLCWSFSFLFSSLAQGEGTREGLRLCDCRSCKKHTEIVGSSTTLELHCSSCRIHVGFAMPTKSLADLIISR